MPEPLKLKDIKLRMQAYGIRPKKQFGQNILADFNLLKAIVADAEIDEAAWMGISFGGSPTMVFYESIRKEMF